MKNCYINVTQNRYNFQNLINKGKLMLKKYSVIGSAAIAATLLLVGCGGGDTTTTTTTVPTGYYIDAAVSGVSYVCGNQSGTTGTDGSFKFQAGQDCNFSLAGITLRIVPAANLVSEVKILENNVSVSQLLQTLDNDGNASNGITITPAVIAAVKTASITTLPADDTAAVALHNAVKTVAGYTGSAKTIAQTEAHMAESQAPILKALIAGKTFYVPDSFTTSANGSVKELISVTFDANVTSLASTILAATNSTSTVGTTSNDTIELNGTKIMFPNDTDPTHKYEEYVGQTADYILLSDNGDLVRLYFDKAKAEAYYLTLSPTTKTTASTFDAAALLAGKTFYAVYKDNGTKYIERVVVNAAGTQLTFTPITPTGASYTDNIAMTGSSITNSTNGSTATVTALTTTYVEIQTAITERWYSSQTDAQTYFNALI